MPVHADMCRYCKQLKPGYQFAILHSLGTRLAIYIMLTVLQRFIQDFELGRGRCTCVCACMCVSVKELALATGPTQKQIV